MLSFTLFVFILVLSQSNGEVKTRNRRMFLVPEWGPASFHRLSDHARDLTSKTLGVILSGSPSIRRATPIETIFGSDPDEDTSNTEQVKENNQHRETEGPIEPTKVDVEQPSFIRRDKEHGIGFNHHNIFNPFNIPLPFSLGLLTPWWRGPNVCVERNEIDEAETDDDLTSMSFSFESTQCIPTATTYTCTKKIHGNGVKKSIVMKYQCCHGYKRSDGKPGCSEVKMDPLIDTVDTIKATKFASLLKSMDVKPNITVFAPSNDAVMEYEEESENNEIVDAVVGSSRRENLRFFTGGHMIDGFVNLDSVKNDQVFPSLNEKTNIRINKYNTPDTVVTANCIPIISKNNFATDGMVHMISEVLPMPQQNIFDIVSENPQFSLFSKLLSQSDLLEEMKEAETSWTLFVPTDTAFKNMEPHMLQRLISGEGCVENVLRQHILKGAMCSPSVLSRNTFENLLGKPMAVIRDESDKLKLEGVRVNVTDIVGTNGVVHILEDVILPTEAYSILETLRNDGREDLLDLVKTSGLQSTFETMKNITFFAPTRDAMKDISNDTVNEWFDDPKLLKKFLLYHIAAPQTPSSSFRHNKELISLADEGNIRLQLHELFPGITMAASAQCSLIVKRDSNVCGGIVHQIDKAFAPPRGSIMEILREMDDHSILLKMLENTELESILDEPSEGPFTLLAPTDEAFNRFEKRTLDDLLKNKTQAEQILRMHVLPEALCCTGINHVLPFRHRYVRTLEGNLLDLHRSTRRDRVRFGQARAVQCDILARNGLVHSVNRVTLPRKRTIGPLLDFDLFSLF